MRFARWEYGTPGKLSLEAVLSVYRNPAPQVEEPTVTPETQQLLREAIEYFKPTTEGGEK